MSVRIIAATEAGLHEIEGAAVESHFAGRRIAAIAGDGSRWWAAVDDREIWRGDGDSWERAAALEDLAARCLLPHEAGLFVGTSEAHLLRLGDGGLKPVASFDAAEGRDDWYTPWGGPPDTRSLSRAGNGTIYANVHVGGILRSADAGATWTPTVDIHADVHEVLVRDDPEPLVLAASARGLATSRDGGDTWEFSADGLHGAYCRAVTVAGETVLVSASTGPFSDRGAVYRRPLEGGPLERCSEGLPEWFPGNVDTGCLSAHGETVALGSPDGSVFLSIDSGASWGESASGLPPVRRVALA